MPGSQTARVLQLAGLALLIVLFPVFSPAHEPTKPAFERPRILLAGGFMLATLDTDVEFNRSREQSGEIDAERDLGLDYIEVYPLLNLAVYFTPKHMLFASYDRIKRDSDVTLGEQVDFDDIIFKPFARAKTDLDTEFVRVAYGYNFFQRLDSEVGFQAGLYYLNIDAEIELKAGLAEDENGDPVSVGTEDNFKEAYPLPTIGIHGGIAFNNEWAIFGWSHLLYIDIDDWEGYILNTYFLGAYHPHPNVGLQFGYQVTGLNFNDDDIDVDYWHFGPALLLSLRF